MRKACCVGKVKEGNEKEGRKRREMSNEEGFVAMKDKGGRKVKEKKRRDE